MTEIPNSNGKAVKIAVIETQLENILASLARIEQKQIADAQQLAEWKTATETRLAIGSQRFGMLERFNKAILAVASAVGMLVLTLIWLILVGQITLVFS